MGFQKKKHERPNFEHRFFLFGPVSKTVPLKRIKPRTFPTTSSKSVTVGLKDIKEPFRTKTQIINNPNIKLRLRMKALNKQARIINNHKLNKINFLNSLYFFNENSRQYFKLFSNLNLSKRYHH
jgi:hypothetical protein